MKTLFRWVFRIFLVLLVLAVLLGIAALLLKDTVAKSLAERNLRDSTGMDVKISRLELGWPTVNLEGLKLYNRPEFGGGTFLVLPELWIEYVPADVQNGKLHLKTVRLNIAEVNVVINKDGKLNIDALQKEAKKKTGGDKKKSDTPGVDFGGIDTLYLTVGKIKITDLGSKNPPQEIDIGLKDEVGKDLKTEADIANWFRGVVIRLAIQQIMTNPNSSALQSLFPGSKPKKQKQPRATVPTLP